MTKAITATACMQLIEQGKLKLDQPAGEILPELKSPMVLDGFDAAGKPKLRPARRAITVRHLMTHTSGYTYPVWSGNILQYEKATGMPDIAYSMNGAFTAPLEFEPGERWQYGISLDWVGKLVEAVTDQSLEIYFRENIFDPLGMRNSGFLIGSAQKKRVAAQTRDRGVDVQEPDRRPERGEDGIGAAGILQQLRPVSRHAAQMGAVVRPQYATRAAWTQRRQWQLGRPAQLLLLDRSGQTRDRRDVHAGAAVLRRARRQAVGPGGRRHLRRPASHLIKRPNQNPARTIA